MLPQVLTESYCLALLAFYFAKRVSAGVPIGDWGYFYIYVMGAPSAPTPTLHFHRCGVCTHLAILLLSI